MIQLDLTGWCSCQCQKNGVEVKKNPLVKYNTNSTGAAVQAEKAGLGFIFSDQARSSELWYRWVFDQFRNLQHQPDQQIATIEELIRNTIGYYWELGERLQSPIVSLFIQGGDCDDMAIMAVTIAETLGHEARFKFIRVDGSPGWHVYAEARNGMKPDSPWIPIDPSMPIGKRGYDIPQAKILESLPFDRQSVAHIQFPAHIVAAIWAHPRQIVTLEGGTLAAAGINYLRAEDLTLFPDDAAGKLIDRLKTFAKKVGTGIKTVVQKVGTVVSKVASSPIVQNIAGKIIPGADVALKTVANVSNKIKGIVGEGSADRIIQGALDLVNQKNPALGNAIKTATESATKPPPTQYTGASLKQQWAMGNVKKGEPITQKVVDDIAKAKAALPSVTPSHTPVLTEFTERVSLSKPEKQAIIKASEVQVPRLADWQLTNLENNAKLLDFLGTREGSQLLDSLPTSIVAQLEPVVLRRRAGVKEKAAKVAEKLVDAIALPSRELPTDIKDVIKVAADTDQLVAVDDAWLRLIRDNLTNAVGQSRGQGTIDYSALQSRHLELMGRREQLIQDIVNRLKGELPKTDAAGSLLDQQFIGRNLGDSFLLLFGAGLPKPEIETYIYRLRDLHRSMNELNTTINALRRTLGA